MYQLQSTTVFDDWIRGLSDKKAKARILARLETVRLGNLGDVKSVGDRIRELRVHVGPGYRVYFTQSGKMVLLLLCGGDKSTQTRDIAKALQLLKRVARK